MSTLAEIQAAIQTLPPSQCKQLAAWLRERRPFESASLDHLATLAGSWQEDAEFDAAIKAFEQVDQA